MRRVLLVGAVLLALALGVAGGYYTGDRLESPEPRASGDAEPLGTPTTPTTPTPSLPVKTPKPDDTPKLQPGLVYQKHIFTVHPGGQTVQLSIKVPADWQLTRQNDRPQEVKYLDPLHERGVRVEAVRPVAKTPSEARKQLVIDLQKSQPPENDLKILRQDDQQLVSDDGTARPVSTLFYTYIPGDTRRYVMVRWVATEGELADVAMSITGLPQDTEGLLEVLAAATKTVHEIG
ncbi:hypothetical protein AB0E69_00980 [Kribbella sp. NPDC026611]|uniref:hypothetical protein n=1 Tax=Kribbella sp. NPDC026611 TaxID=3154911 RepID=UPI0033C2F2F6